MAQSLNKTQRTQVRERAKGAKAMLKAIPAQLWRHRRDRATHDYLSDFLSNKPDIIIMYYYC